MTPNSPVVYTTCETVLDKFTGCEVVFTAGKNAALFSCTVYSRRFGHFVQCREQHSQNVYENVAVKFVHDYM